MLQKAATSFSPFKLSHLHNHLRSAINNLGNASASTSSASASASASSSAGAAASGSSSSSALGGAANHAGGAGGAKWHAGRSYSYQAFGRGNSTPAANAAASNDTGTSSGRQSSNDDDQAEENAALMRSLRWRTGTQAAAAARVRSTRLAQAGSSSMSSSNPGLTTAVPVSSTSSISSILPRSSPYASDSPQIPLQVRYRHAFSRAKQPQLLLTATPSSSSYKTRPQHLNRHSTASVSSDSQPRAPFSTTPASTPTTRAPARRRALSLPRATPSPQLRRNSTSSISQSQQTNQDPIPPILERSKSAGSDQSTVEAASTASASEPTVSPEVAATEAAEPDVPSTPSRRRRNSASNFPDLRKTHDQLFQQILYAENTHDFSRLRLLARKYRSQEWRDAGRWTSALHGRFMQAFHRLRSYAPQEAVHAEVLELWNDHFSHDHLPVYQGKEDASSAPEGQSQGHGPSQRRAGGVLYVESIAVYHFAERALETARLVKRQGLHNNLHKLGSAGAVWSEGKKVDLAHLPSASAGENAENGMQSAASLAALRQQADEDYTAARSIAAGVLQARRELTYSSLAPLLRAAAERGDIETALAAFGALEGNPRKGRSQAGPGHFADLLKAYEKEKEWVAVFTVFDGFKKGIGRKSVRRTRDIAKDANGEPIPAKAADLLETASDAGTDVLAEESQDDATSSQNGQEDIQVWNAAIHARFMQGEEMRALELLEQMMQGQAPIPKPDASTLITVIQSFAETGDLEAAFRWTNRIHSTPTPSGFPAPPATLEETFNAILAYCKPDVAKIQEAAEKTPLLQQLGQHIKAFTDPPADQDAPDATTSSDARSGLSPSLRSPSSPAPSSALGSVFSDASLRTQTLSITPPPITSKPLPDGEAIVIDFMHSSKIDDLTRGRCTPLEVYGLVKSGRRDGRHAHPEALSRLIKKLAEDGLERMPVIQDCYKIAYDSIAALSSPMEQTSAWAYLEDRMLIAMANLGELEKAATHRDRLLKAGAAPSADAYAAMITSARDTTDDATVALELFEEARRFGVVPNLFLYNILISKISRARKTHMALSYFEQMKLQGIRPSAVTYGSVIAACCRTGDEKAATFLFNEMVNSPGFRPRVPPYNTMMQFFTMTLPDREKALGYFDAMLKANVAPTGHTYKLLLDAYGAIQPVDIASVNDVFSRLVADANVTVSGAHWASLLGAYGIGMKEVDKTIEIFESIAEHPSAQHSKTKMPDVITYEGLFNVFLANNRGDLLEKYLGVMQQQFVRPTAYIYNSLIRAQTAAGDVQKARDTFESLSDPPSGVHASGNHAPETAPADGAVYREPSTYEAMIKCEVTVGEKERAEELLQRAVARAFPAAVIARMERIVRGEEKISLL